jgi:O-antigen/teichoic acid export membrane protein
MSIRRSLAFSFLEKYASTAINLVSTLVLARLLSPAEIGVFSVGAAVVGIMHALRDFGVTNYLIQEREVDHEKLRTAFTVTLGLSWLFAAVLLAGADWAAGFYREEGVRQIVWVMAANFVLIPFGSPILALMRRELQFARLAAIQLAATAVNAGTGIALAAAGHGFMSLAWASLAGVAVTSGLAFACRPHVFLLKPGLREWRSVFAFGSYASANALLGDLRQTAPDLIMGRMLGFEPVGLFSRALGLIHIFNKIFFEGLQPVLLPALAEKVRRGEDLREIYLKAMEHVSVLYWPFLVFLAFMADPIIHILLGDQWMAAAPLVRILCVGVAISFPAFLTQPLLMSMGRIRDTFILNAVLLPVTVAVFVLGSLHSVEMVAILSAPASLASILIVLHFIGRFVAVSLFDILYATRKSAVVTLAAALVPALLPLWTGWEALGPLLGLVLAGGAFGLVWLAAIYLTRHPLQAELRDVLRRLPHLALRR